MSDPNLDDAVGVRQAVDECLVCHVAHAGFYAMGRI